MRTFICRLNGDLWLGWATALILVASPAHGDGFDEHYEAYYGVHRRIREENGQYHLPEDAPAF